MDQLDLFARLPRRPYCATAKDAPRRIRPQALALGYPYIQPNPPQVVCWLVFDIDRPQAAVAWEDADLPAPSFTVARRDRSDSAHLWYGLRIPVKKADQDTRSMRFAAAIESGMQHQLNADLAYSGMLAKTPEHPVWRTLRGPGVYDLEDLAQHLRQLPKLPTRTEAIKTGIGRNVELFDTTRQWAYRAVKRFDSYDGWHAAVRERAQILNASLFSNPLPGPEVNHTAKSIAGWVWKNHTTGGFSRIQSARAKRGGTAITAAAQRFTTLILEADT